MSQQHDDAMKIYKAYDEAEQALRKVGKLLRTTEAGMYMWSAKHKTAISGLCVCVSSLRDDVPSYATDIITGGKNKGATR